MSTSIANDTIKEKDETMEEERFDEKKDPTDSESPQPSGSQAQDDPLSTSKPEASGTVRNNRAETEATASSTQTGEEEIVVEPVRPQANDKPTKAASAKKNLPPMETVIVDESTLKAAEKTDADRPSRKHKGLSELSKQLRILQAKNQAQSIEIDRLERQLRILAELKGVDVSALRKSLDKACEAEAHEELQHQIAKLKAQLEVVQLAKQPASSVEDAAASNKIANYELRVGELEEVEEKHKAQIKYLYDQLKVEKERKMRLEAKCTQKQNEVDRLMESHTEKSVVMSNLEQMQGAQIRQLSDKAHSAETELHILLERLKLSEHQRVDAEEQAKLRSAQYKARFMVQDERIKDLEQQLSSLYAAFGLIDEEHTEDDKARRALQNNLDRADEAVARQLLATDETRVSYVAVSPEPMAPTSSPRSPKRKSIRSVPTSPKPEYVKQANLVISGFVLVRTTGMLKQWKQRHMALYSALSRHYLDIGEGKGYYLEFGISKVEPHHKVPFGFSVVFDPDHRTTTLFCAAENRQDFIQWMTELMKATTGEDYADSPVQPYPGEEFTEQEAMELAHVLEKSTLDL